MTRVDGLWVGVYGKPLRIYLYEEGKRKFLEGKKPDEVKAEIQADAVGRLLAKQDMCGSYSLPVSEAIKRIRIGVTAAMSELRTTWDAHRKAEHDAGSKRVYSGTLLKIVREVWNEKEWNNSTKEEFMRVLQERVAKQVGE